MNIYKSLIFIFSLLLSLSASSQTLWGKALAGDSILDIKKKYPAGIDIDKPVSGTDFLSYRYSLKNININGQNFEAFFIFSKKYGLKSIEIKSTGNFSSDDCRIVKNKTFAALTAKYGQPDDGLGLGMIFTWKINGVDIQIVNLSSAQICLEIKYKSTKEDNISSDNL